MNALWSSCDTCKARSGDPCRLAAGHPVPLPRGAFHQARVSHAKAAAPDGTQEPRHTP